ncbi:MAG TPA: hypothetical protein PLG90_06185 [Ignavibacteria bacterium]|nr:hypothetical protein [Ignavibacteria bacterium]
MKTLFAFLAFVFLSSLIFQNSYSQSEQIQKINRLSLNSEIMKVNSSGTFEYDAYLFCMRKVVNGKQLPAQQYDDVSYRIYAEAVFLKDKREFVDVDGVTCAGMTLRRNAFGLYEVAADTSNMSSLSPGVVWNVQGGLYTPQFYEDITSSLKFPEFYYIHSYGNNITLNSDDPWNITVRKWKEDAGFALERPDMLFTWILGPTNNPNDNLRNLQACGRFQNVTQTDLTAGVDGKYIRSVFEGAKIIPGEGCAVVRTVKLIPKNVFSSLPLPMNQNWLFVMIVETEVPVTFN